MPSKRPLPSRVVAAIDRSRMLSIRAGLAHRFIGIWAVVVERRVFVRSWSLEPRSWYRTFLEDPIGAIQVGGRTLAIRAVRARGERMKDAVSRAYLEKYRRGSIAGGRRRRAASRRSARRTPWASGRGTTGARASRSATPAPSSSSRSRRRGRTGSARGSGAGWSRRGPRSPA
ncbi:MAG: DUF2255 family protein [Acidobacteria bacterium]|nr:DUF2255 family protein [Acidobacteriota bacterium]